ncbi:MAG: C40 family peptidase [Anaerovoracaceae bacterium]
MYITNVNNRSRVITIILAIVLMVSTVFITTEGGMEAEAARVKGTQVVSYAKKFVGNPYVYGGNSLTNGTDCSGFVKLVYKKYGEDLPRSSYAYRSVGRSVSYSQARPGDIVCYSGHVAIYAGNGKIVHAARPGKGICVGPATYTSILTVRRVI